MKKPELESTIAKIKKFGITNFDNPFQKNMNGNVENIRNGDNSENKEVTYGENTIWSRVGDIII